MLRWAWFRLGRYKLSEDSGRLNQRDPRCARFLRRILLFVCLILARSFGPLEPYGIRWWHFLLRSTGSFLLFRSFVDRCALLDARLACVLRFLLVALDAILSTWAVSWVFRLQQRTVVLRVLQRLWIVLMTGRQAAINPQFRGLPRCWPTRWWTFWEEKIHVTKSFQMSVETFPAPTKRRQNVSPLERVND